jgi:hypothetical protein
MQLSGGHARILETIRSQGAHEDSEEGHANVFEGSYGPGCQYLDQVRTGRAGGPVTVWGARCQDSSLAMSKHGETRECDYFSGSITDTPSLEVANDSWGWDRYDSRGNPRVNVQPATPRECDYDDPSPRVLLPGLV